jgi:hypothetical protein
MRKILVLLSIAGWIGCGSGSAPSENETSSVTQNTTVVPLTRDFDMAASSSTTSSTGVVAWAGVLSPYGNIGTSGFDGAGNLLARFKFEPQSNGNYALTSDVGGFRQVVTDSNGNLISQSGTLSGATASKLSSLQSDVVSQPRLAPGGERPGGGGPQQYTQTDICLNSIATEVQSCIEAVLTPSAAHLVQCVRDWATAHVDCEGTPFEWDMNPPPPGCTFGVSGGSTGQTTCTIDYSMDVPCSCLY